MKNIRTILVDDERAGRSRLRRMLEREPDLEILAECGDGMEAVAAVHEHAPDLLFLDINMPGLDGFGVLDALGPERQPPVVIFVTAYDEHAVRAFEACALDYVLKPASPERLAKALSRARDRILPAPNTTAITATAPIDKGTAPASPGAPAGATPMLPHRFMVRSGGRVSFVAPEEIDWVEAAGNYMILHAGPANHMIRETMAGMEERLPGDAFMRVSRSALVKLSRVKELHTSPAGDHTAILTDGQRVHLTRPLREVADRLASM